MTDITDKNNNYKITKNLSASTSTLTSVSTSIGLTSMKSVNENKLTVEQTSVGAMTLSTMTRYNLRSTIAQQKNKDIESNYSKDTLEESLNTLKTLKIPRNAEIENHVILILKNLHNKLEQNCRRTLENQNNEENLVKLKQFQEKCKAQEILISEQTKQLTNLKLQEKIIEDLRNEKEKLQALIHKMDRERRILRNIIQELKGNIRVFCRVRPRTPKEIEQMKV